jgi:hypothetical protein
MLNGRYPLLIFSFPANIPVPLSDTLSGVPLVGELVPSTVPIPIPIYLDPNLTGIEVDTEQRSVDIKTDQNQFLTGDSTDTKQRGLNNEVSITLLCERDSTMLSVLLTFFDQIFKRLANSNFTVTYLNGPTTVFGGKLSGAQTSQSDARSGMIELNIRITKTESTPVSLTNVDTIQGVAGNLPPTAGIA